MTGWEGRHARRQRDALRRVGGGWGNVGGGANGGGGWGNVGGGGDADGSGWGNVGSGADGGGGWGNSSPGWPNGWGTAPPASGWGSATQSFGGGWGSAPSSSVGWGAAPPTSTPVPPTLRHAGAAADEGEANPLIIVACVGATLALLALLLSA